EEIMELQAARDAARLAQESAAADAAPASDAAGPEDVTAVEVESTTPAAPSGVKDGESEKSDDDSASGPAVPPPFRG
ncbi:MAG: hypothetical protein K2K92_08900, partial [Duncaniella sp.]|nr:hypothetical protein [Duncaniella sp.]